MALTLTRHSAGSTQYVADMNNNQSLIEGAINANTAAIGGGGGGGGTAAFTDIWTTSGMIGASSFVLTLASDSHISLTSGSVWHFDTQARGRQTSAQQISFVGKSSGTFQLIADTTGLVTTSTTSTAVAIYQVYYSAPSFGSAERLVPYLFDGEDYDRALSGAIFGSHVRLADHLSALEGALTVDGLYAQSAASGLTWDFNAGHFRDNNAITSTAAATVTLSASQTHYIEVAISDGSVSYATGGWTASTAIPIRFVETDATDPISNTDPRTWATVPGGGGGTPGVVNSGTTDGLWTLYRATGAGSSPVSDASITVDRGSQASVEIRFNETTDVWEFTGDGTSYTALGALTGLNIGGGIQTRFTAVVSAPLVLNQTARDPTSAPPYESLSLSAHVSTTTTAAMLRGYVTELSNPSFSVGSALGIVFFRDSATITNEAAARIFASPDSGPVAATVVVPVSDQSLVYEVTAASEGTINVTIALVGFWDQIPGVGTAVAKAVSGTDDNLSVNVSTTDFALSTTTFSAVANRAMIYFLQTSTTMPAGSLFDLEIYSSDGGDSTQLLFQALNIDSSATYTTRLPWMYLDNASNNEVYLRVSNNAASAGLLSFEWRGERFA
jgi:hypothetical protein